MKFRLAPHSFSLIGAALILGACADGADVTGPVDGTPAPAVRALATVVCSADVAAGTIDCAAPGEGAVVASTGKSQLRRIILGGQGEFVQLTSANVEVVDNTFAFDVTVENLIEQPLGTINGQTADPNAVRVFFADGPNSGEDGVISVGNPDGIGTFTETSQPYFRYEGILPSGAVTAPRRWELQFTEGVNTFSFTLYVAAEVQYPEGYVQGVPYVVTLNPNESRVLSSSVRAATGRPAADAAPTDWSSDNPVVVSVSESLATAGAGRGFAVLTATSGSRPAVYPTAVSVCEATVVTDGTVLPSSISSSDCFSSYGGNSGLPTTSYYGDLYRVELNAGETLTVTMDSGDDLDTYLLLASMDHGFIVAGNDDDDEGTLGYGSRMIYTATDTGVYVIEGSTYNSLDTGDYILGIEIDAPGVAMSRATAAPAPRLGR